MKLFTGDVSKIVSEIYVISYLRVSRYVIKYPDPSAANIYGASTAPASMTYAVKQPPTARHIPISIITVTGKMSVRFASIVPAIYKNRDTVPSAMQNKNAYTSLI